MVITELNERWGVLLEQVIVTIQVQLLACFLQNIDKVCSWRHLDFNPPQIGAHNLNMGGHLESSLWDCTKRNSQRRISIRGEVKMIVGWMPADGGVGLPQT